MSHPHPPAAARGERGPQGHDGPAGPAGRSLSRDQALVLFFLFVLALSVTTIRSEIMDNRLRTQQAQISANAHTIAVQRYNNCVRSVGYIVTFNKAWRDLAEVERTQKIDPALSKRRVAVYESLIYPQPVSVAACGPKP